MENDFYAAKEAAMGWLGLWAGVKERESSRLKESLKKVRRRIKRAAAAKVRSPLLRGILKLIDAGLRLWAKRLVVNIKNLRREREELKEAMIELEDGNPDQAIDLLGDGLLAVASFDNRRDVDGFPSPGSSCFAIVYVEIVDGLTRGAR